jgi:hypothetical protein
MSIKRLNHHAQNFGQMFCGWELMFDYKRLAELKNGELRINILENKCFHNGSEIEPLKISSAIRNWMVEDLEANKLKLSEVEKAELVVEFKTERILGQSIAGSSWADPTPYFVNCTLKCSSVINAKNREFTSSYWDEEEWPESYSWVNS